ncbi:cadherin-like domain-containing protein [Bathymodiolus japonicus methanotrophic gill symbiont]|uniref:cadherin-like domain-containing protein n=1 Tax=Bathymodiolus japonicus methanotrophic gill symbiont TaxID=113269 RepID=UPI0021E17446|nr:cadherin-like domain-containing protein [Bathymodiolus japonicus methanotrophic gill symbiont]
MHQHCVFQLLNNWETSVLQVNVANGLLANDSDPDANILQPIIVTQPANGIVHVLAGGSFSYQPNSGFSGVNSFTYKANDGIADSNTAIVKITVNAVNHAPIAKAGNYSTPRNVPLQVRAPGILTGVSDPDGDQLTARLITPPAEGSLHMNHDGSFTYTPKPAPIRRAALANQVSFTFVVSDGSKKSAKTVIQNFQGDHFTAN